MNHQSKSWTKTKKSKTTPSQVFKEIQPHESAQAISNSKTKKAKITHLYLTAFHPTLCA